jgi:hypothetical protein
MGRRNQEPNSMNAFIVIGVLYILGYFNPDTREAFMWAGLIVGILISVAALVWITGRMIRRKNHAQGAKIAQAPKASLLGPEERFERRATGVTDSDRDSVGV